MKPTASQFALHLLDVCRGYLGENRSDNRDQIARFLRLFGLAFVDEHGKPYAFCAAGIGWAAVKSYCDLCNIHYTADNAPHVFAEHRADTAHAFLPLSPACEQIREQAIERGMYEAINFKQNESVVPLPGWLVLYSWDGKSVAHHVGVVEKNEDDEIVVVEFNTSSNSDGNGGSVERKTRPYTHILGFVKTWEDTPVVKPAVKAAETAADKAIVIKAA